MCLSTRYLVGYSQMDWIEIVSVSMNNEDFVMNRVDNRIDNHDYNSIMNPDLVVYLMTLHKTWDPGIETNSAVFDCQRIWWNMPEMTDETVGHVIVCLLNNVMDPGDNHRLHTFVVWWENSFRIPWIDDVLDLTVKAGKIVRPSDLHGIG